MKTINYKNYVWNVLEENDNTLKLITKDVVKCNLTFEQAQEFIKKFGKQINEPARMLSIDEAIHMKIEELKCDDWYWLSDFYLNTNNVWVVFSSGYVRNNYADNSYGVRPVIEIDKFNDEYKIKKAIEFLKKEHNNYPSAEEWRSALIKILEDK